MPSDPREGLIDRIYEAAVVPEQWLKVLDALSAIADGDGALIFTRVGFNDRWIGVGGAERVHKEAIETGWNQKNNRGPRLFAAQYPGFLNDLDVFAPEELNSDPYFAEFLRPRGYGWGAATAVQVPNGDMIAFDVERRLERGPVERPIIRLLDKLRPHLARASLISARLSFERVRSAAETLSLIGLPAVVLGARGQPLAVNSLFEPLIPKVVTEGAGRLVLTTRAADALLVEALERLVLPSGSVGVRSIPIPVREGNPAMIFHLVPVRGAAHDLFSAALAMLVVTPVEPRSVPAAAVLQGLFDLTPAEARVARAVSEGATVAEIANAHDLSKETVRSQLKSALAKTGLGRQADLARLLSGLMVPPG